MICGYRNEADTLTQTWHRVHKRDGKTGRLLILCINRPESLILDDQSGIVSHNQALEDAHLVHSSIRLHSFRFEF